MGQEAGGGEAKGLAPERWERHEESSRRNPRRPKGRGSKPCHAGFPH